MRLCEAQGSAVGGASRLALALHVSGLCSQCKCLQPPQYLGLWMKMTFQRLKYHRIMTQFIVGINEKNKESNSQCER